MESKNENIWPLLYSPSSLLGFFLGDAARATDPDHVVAVTTIVSRERTMLHAAVIGALWGLGHTFTILVVGSAIILFKLTIPARLGLSMELCVAFMLILLGILNLTGMMQRAIEWITIRRVGSDAHSHFLLWALDGPYPRRAMVSPVFIDHGSVLGMDSRMVEEVGTVSRPASVRSRNCAFGLAGSAAVALLVGLTTITRPSVGDCLPADFRAGHRRRDDVDYSCDRTSLCLHVAKLRTIKSWPQIVRWLPGISSVCASDYSCAT